MSNRVLASRSRLLSVLMLLAMVLASVTMGASAQTARDVNDPTPGSQSDRMIRTDGAKPGIYYIDYLNEGDKLSPATFPVDGGLGFWIWSALNPTENKYDWDTNGAKKLDTWIKNRAASGLSTGIMISTYDATNANDIRSTPNWVIKLNDAVIPATNSASDSSPNYIDYFRRTARKQLNGRFDEGLNRWTVNNSSVIMVTSTGPADGEGVAAPPSLQLGGAPGLSASAIHDAEVVPAMPPSLVGSQNVFITARVNIATTDPGANDLLYIQLLDSANNVLAELPIDNLSHSGQAANYWKTYTLDVSTVAPEKSVKVALAVSNDGANPTTFYVDNVTLNVRHLIPKYWGDTYKNAYKKFIGALGTRYKDTKELEFIAMGTGTYGESQPTQDQPVNYDHVVKAAGLTTTKMWSDWVNEISGAYAAAFASGDPSGPSRHIMLQYAPSFMSGDERGITTDYAAGLGVGLSHNRLTPEFTSLFRNDRSGFYDPMRLHWNTVPIAMEAYNDDIGCSPVLTYWSVFAALHQHTDYLRTDPKLLRASMTQQTVHAPFFDWAQNYLGKTVQNTPKVWTVMREHRNPAVFTCGQSFYVDSTTGSTYPQYGNFNFWLYQVDTVAGGKTVAETNDKGADKTYAKNPANGASAPLAGLGNCPEKSYSNIYVSNPPSCNPVPYNKDLPPLVGQSAEDLYDPGTWTGAGKEAWLVRRTDQATNNPYMFFRVDDGYMAGGSQVYRANITIKYFDIGTDQFSIKYDSASGVKEAGRVTKTGTKAMITKTFLVEDAKFANGLTGSTDFYLDSRNPENNQNDGNEWLHMIEVEKLGAGDPPTPTPTDVAPTTGSVEGIAFHDLNNNGALDQGENGLAGAVFTMSDLVTPDKYSATSNATGVFRFDEVAPGQYTLKEKTAPSGFLPNTQTTVAQVTAGNTWITNTNRPYRPLEGLDNKTYLPVLLK